MTGWLIVNGFLKSKKFDELTAMFLQAAERAKVHLHIVKNTEILADTGKVLKDKPDFAIFWDKDLLLGMYLEQAGIRLFNRSSCVRLCDDKRLTHLVMTEHQIPTVRTIFAPMTYENIGFTELDFLRRVEKELSYPLVMKEAFGSFGEQVYRIHSREELLAYVQNSHTNALLFQPYIAHSCGRDVRLQVVGDRVVAAMYRWSDTDFRANITAGGHMKPYDPTREEQELALRAARAVGADFAGVDLLFGEEGPLLCEINSNAHFKNLWDCTGVNVAEEILSLIQNS
jgi:RimK family alpha-L-glutamate ligase